MLQLLKDKKGTMSNTVKEFESRIMLTESEYFDIVSYYMRQYPNKSFLKNVNIYFDTGDYYLKNNHQTLRIRIINDSKYELTIKISNKNGDDEINDVINKKDADMILTSRIFPEGNVKEYLNKLPYSLDSYKTITILNNLRLEIENDDHLLVIDKNLYNDIIDYNLEIEAKDSMETANKLLQGYIKQFNLSRTGQKYTGKAHRAIDSAINKR